MVGLFFQKVESSFSTAFDFMVVPDSDRRFVLILFFLTVLFHLPQITGFFLSIDDEGGVFRTDLSIWIAQGRWGIYLIYKLFGIKPTLPFIYNLFFCGILTYSSFLLQRLFKLPINSMFVWAGLFFTSWPTYWFILEFYGNIVPTSLGILFSIVSCSLLFNERDVSSFFRYGLSCFLLAFAISLYQVLVLYAIVIGIIYFFLKFSDKSQIPNKQVLKFAIFILFGLALYFLIQQLILRISGVSVQYIDSLITTRFWKEDPFKVLSLFYEEFLTIYLGSQKVYGNPMFGFKILLCLFWLVLLIKTRNKLINLLVSVLLVILIAVIPMTLNLASNGIMFYRTMIAVPLVIWFVVAFLLSKMPEVLHARFYWVVYSVLAFTFFNVLSSVSAYQASTYLCINHDQNTAALIYNRISQKVPGFSRDSTYKVFVYGYLNFHNAAYPDVMSSTMQGSFFEWDNGSSGRVATFLNLMGYNNLVSGQGNDFDVFKPFVNTMKPWPNDSSIVYQKGYVLIKLGN